MWKITLVIPPLFRTRVVQLRYAFFARDIFENPRVTIACIHAGTNLSPLQLVNPVTCRNSTCGSNENKNVTQSRVKKKEEKRKI